MRLTCPNCDAQYEVDKGVIPDGGRDVQCSNCGQTWFESPAAEHDSEEEFDDNAEAMAGLEAALRDDVGEDGEDDEGDGFEDGEAEAEPESLSQEEPERRELDEVVLDVLREEAERETRARAVEHDPVDPPQAQSNEDEPDTDTRRDEIRSRTSRLRGEEPEPEPMIEAPDAAPRRDLLPDIEEINSTLRAASDREEDIDTTEEIAEPQARRSGGFRRGFLMMITLFIVAAAVYILAPQISEKVPALSATLTTYVDGVDALRLRLDEAMRSAVEALRGSSEG